MDVYKPLITYVMKMTGAVSSAKVLYLDSETTGIIAQILSQSQAFAEDIFLIHTLGVNIPKSQGTSNLAHLAAIIFCRPTHENIEKIIEHLQSPKHQSYYIFFSNQLEEPSLSRLAQADQCEVVQQVQELFADFYPLNNDLWSLETDNQSLYYLDEKEWTNANESQFERELQGLCAFLLSVKKRPLIRWQKSSHLANKLANSIRDMIETENELFGWSEPDLSPLLLICDRREDPITPLLSQWTYQAMVHELIGLKNSRCVLHKEKSNKLNEIVLNPFNDSFFANNKCSTFGDLGVNVKKLVDKFAKQVKGSRNIKSMEDMQKFVENYSDYLSKQGNVSKHVAVMSELSGIVAKRKLLDISAIEQEIVCQNDWKSHFLDVERTIKDPSVADYDKLRLAIIYALRYQNKNDKSSELRTLLRTNLDGNGEVYGDIGLLDVMLRNFGSAKREMNLFEEEKSQNNLMGKIGSLVKIVNGMDEVQNIYTQHNPLLHYIIEHAVKCKLPYAQFPSFQGAHKQQPRHIIIYYIGGATFEEAAVVAQLNKHFGNKTDIVLGSGMIHNSKTFLNDVKKTYGKNLL